MLGDEYTLEQWKAYAEFITFDPDDDALCPLCEEKWEIERQEDLCYCQFAKRRRSD